MSLHRLATANIRIHDSGSFDSGFDPALSGSSIRSQPRDIPFKHSSPTSIPSSYHATDVPPPLLPIHPIADWATPVEPVRERYDKPPKSPGETGNSRSIGWGSSGSNRSFRGDWDKLQDEGLRDARNGLRVTKRYWLI